MTWQVTIQGEWSLWTGKVPKIEVETHNVGSPDVVVPTLDTVRHESLLYTWLQEHKPMVLCGPPGSGKTMTLFSALRALPDYEVLSTPHYTTPHRAKCNGQTVLYIWLRMHVWSYHCPYSCAYKTA